MYRIAVAAIFFAFSGAILMTAANPIPVSAQPAGSPGLLVVVSQTDSSVSLLDPADGKQLGSVTVPVRGHEVAVSPDHKLAYVPIYGDSGVGRPGSSGSEIVVIDIATQKIVRTIDLGHGVRPHAAVFGPDGNLYVTAELDQAVDVIDPRTDKLIGQIPTGQPESHMFVIAPDGRHAYTTNVGPGTISVLDLVTRKTLAIIPVSTLAQRIALTPDGSRLFTSDIPNSRVAVIDTATNKVANWIPFPDSTYSLATTPDGHWLLASERIANQVSAVNLTTLKIMHTFPVPEGPTEILIRPDGKFAFIACGPGHTVVVLDLTSWTVAKFMPAGPGADGMAWVPKD